MAKDKGTAKPITQLVAEALEGQNGTPALVGNVTVQRRGNQVFVGTQAEPQAVPQTVEREEPSVNEEQQP